MAYDYRRTRDAIMGIVRDTEGRPVGYEPGSASIRERMLLVALLEFAPDIRPAKSTLAVMLGISEREVRRLITSAKAKGLLRIEERPGQPNRYHLTVPTRDGSDPPVAATHDTPDPPTHDKSDPPPMTNPTPEADKKQTIQADKDLASQSSAPLSLVNPTSRKDPSAHKRVTDHYFQVYEKHRGCKPPFKGPEGKAVTRLLENLDGNADLACKAITDGYASWKGGTLSIRGIASDPGSYIGAPPAQQKPNGPRPVQNSAKQVHGNSRY